MTNQDIFTIVEALYSMIDESYLQAHCEYHTDRIFKKLKFTDDDENGVVTLEEFCASVSKTFPNEIIFIVFAIVIS